MARRKKGHFYKITLSIREFIDNAEVLHDGEHLFSLKAECTEKEMVAHLLSSGMFVMQNATDLKAAPGAALD